jgi:hypothetical protein
VRLACRDRPKHECCATHRPGTHAWHKADLTGDIHHAIGFDGLGVGSNRSWGAFCAYNLTGCSASSTKDVGLGWDRHPLLNWNSCPIRVSRPDALTVDMLRAGRGFIELLSRSAVMKPAGRDAVASIEMRDCIKLITSISVHFRLNSILTASRRVCSNGCICQRRVTCTPAAQSFPFFGRVQPGPPVRPCLKQYHIQCALPPQVALHRFEKRCLARDRTTALPAWTSAWT